MHARGWVSLLLTAVLVAGVAAKIGPGRPLADDAEAAALPAVAAFLERQGLRLLRTQTDLNLTLMEARRPPDCRMTVALMAPQGWHGGIVASLARPDAPPFFVFDGALHDEQPTGAARAQHYWGLALRRFGIPAPVHPMIGVIASPSCAARAFPWREVAAIVPPGQAGTAARK